jgi:hypothetical protein
MVVTVSLGELFEETLQAPSVHPRKINAEALSCCRLDRRIEVSPLVGAPDDVGWTKAFGRVSPLVPIDESETSFIKG